MIDERDEAGAGPEPGAEHTRPTHPDRPCMNCGDPTPGEYCPSCGQRKADIRVSVRTLAMEVLEDQFILDKRLPRTLGTLLFKPGRLTIEYINGRMVRYIHPFRLYLVSSLLFFLLLSFFGLQLVRQAMEDDDATAVAAAARADEAESELTRLRGLLADTTLAEVERTALRDTARQLEARRTARLDSVQAAVEQLGQDITAVEQALGADALPSSVRATLEARREGLQRQRESAVRRQQAILAGETAGKADPGVEGDAPGEPSTIDELFGWSENPPDLQLRPPALDSAVENRIRRLGRMTPREAAETLTGTFFNYVPTMMFILLPVFAVVLKLLYVRRRRFYAEHFVFLLHVHSVVFILAAVMLLLRNAVPAWVDLMIFGWILVYIYLAMLRVYGQGWLKTFAKYWTLGWMYFWILLASLGLAFVAVLLFF